LRLRPSLSDAWRTKAKRLLWHCCI
jgi:hypothetical protein